MRAKQQEARTRLARRGCIGPAYEDKVARRAIRLQDLLYRERFIAKLKKYLIITISS